MGVSIHYKIIEVSKIHHYNDIHKIAKPGFLHLLLQFERSCTKLAHLYTFIFIWNSLLFPCAVLLANRIFHFFSGRVALENTSFSMVEYHFLIIMHLWFHVTMSIIKGGACAGTCKERTTKKPVEHTVNKMLRMTMLNTNRESVDSM